MSNSLLISEILPQYKTNIFLIDTGPSSVNDREFLNFKTAASDLIKNEEEFTNFIIYKYCRDNNNEPFESNKKDEVIEYINNIKYESGFFYSSSLNKLLTNVQNKINTLMNKQVSIVIFSNGKSSDNPKPTIDKLIKKDVSFLCIHYKNVNSLIRQYFPEDTPFHDTDDCLKYQKSLKQSIIVPFHYEFFLNNSQLQRSNKDLSLTLKLHPVCDQIIYNKNDIKIEIYQNKYYSGHKIIVDKTVSWNSPLESKFILRIQGNKTINDLDTIVKFKVQVNDLEFNGFFKIDLAWLTGDFVTNKDINIWVEGPMGTGKSSVLNMFLNLFTSNKPIYHRFLSSNKGGAHITESITFNKISKILEYYQQQPDEWLPVYKQIQENVKISLVDKPGIFENDGRIDYKHAFNGNYHEGTGIKMLFNSEAKPEYKCHVVIFVISLSLITSGAKKPQFEHVKERIGQLIDDVKIQPILVVTFCDNFSDLELIEQKRKVYTSDLPIQSKNIFFLTPYINEETIRNHDKDLQAWKILTKAVNIGLNTLISKESNPPISTSPNSGSSTPPITSSPHCGTPPTPPPNENNIPFSLTIHYNTLNDKIKLPFNQTLPELYKSIKSKYSINQDFSLLDDSEFELIGEGLLSDYIKKESSIKVVLKEK